MLDIDECREETPGCRSKIHFNNAGASLMPASVLGAMTDYLDLEAIMGGYETADLKAEDIEGFYDSLAKLLSCLPPNIAFMSSATSAFAKALSCIPFTRGDSILIAREDYISNQLAFLSIQKRFGIVLLRAESLPEGGVDVDDMKRLMDRHHPKLVSLTHIPTNSGLIQPVEAVGALCRERNIPYLVDACQSAGQLPLDVSKINCDFLSGTFRKFLRGPRGAGFLYVSDTILQKSWEPLFIDMRGGDWTEKDAYTLRPDARRFEEWELPYALVMGSKAAVDYALKTDLQEISDRNSQLCSLVRKKLEAIGLTPLDQGQKLGSIITVKIPDQESATVLQMLRKKSINTSISTRGYALIDFDAKGVNWALRISPHYYNTENEVDKLQQALVEIMN